MMTRTTLAIAVALQFMAAPVMAQAASDKDGNAHHYQGGPQTGVPHSAKHTKPSNANAKAPLPAATTIAAVPRASRITWAKSNRHRPGDHHIGRALPSYMKVISFGPGT
jgi:hypothetical protein